MSFPATWATARVTDVCTLNPGLAPEDRPDAATEVTFVPMSAVDQTAGAIVASEVRLFDEVGKGYTAFRESDVLFAKVTPCMENGKAAVVPPVRNGLGFGSTEFHVLRAGDSILPEYLFHFIRQQAFRERAASAFVGTGGLQRVPADFFSRIHLPLPTLPEQKRIVDVLRQAEAIRKAKQSVSDQVDALVRTAYWEHFGASYTENGLRDAVRIADCVAESRYGVSEAMEETGSHAVLRMNSLTTSGWLDLSDLKYASLSRKDVEATELKDGDLLFNRTNSRELVGKCAIWRDTPGAFSFASYLVRLRLKPGVLPEFLWATLNSAYGKYRLLNAAKQAVSMANVSPTDLSRIAIPLPPLPLQERFSALVKRIETLRTQMLGKLAAFDELQNVVRQRAFLGELTEQWRERHAAEIEAAANERDTLLRGRGVQTNSVSGIAHVGVSVTAKSTVRGGRRWLLDELSAFQLALLGAFTAYCANTGLPLLAEDADAFTDFCDSDEVVERLQAFGAALNNRIRRSLSQLAALGLIAKIALPKENPNTRGRDYLKAFRPLREDEHTGLSDLERIRRALTGTEQQRYYAFSVHLDYETSERAGAGGMFQVISVEGHGKDFTRLVDQGFHYASLDELQRDLAQALKVSPAQVKLEEV